MNKRKYDDQFRDKMKDQPLRQSLRLIDFAGRRMLRKLQLTKVRRKAFQQRAGEPSPIVRVSSRLQPPPHRYVDYRGPWIEDSFFHYWANLTDKPACTYLPIFWTDFYQWSQSYRYMPRAFADVNAEIKNLLDRISAGGKCHFTVLEYTHPIWDWHAFPKNVIVFSAGGGGDIPIPLLKGSPALERGEKRDTRTSFFGRLDGASDAGGLRPEMHRVMQDYAYFGIGPEWRNVMRRSTFTLCPRGLGRTSFRIYEALAVCSIPVYIWDDLEWLPYQDQLDWSEFSVSIHRSQLSELPHILDSFDEPQLQRMRDRIAELYDDYFTLPGTCRQIARMANEYQDVDRILAKTSTRDGKGQQPKVFA